MNAHLTNALPRTCVDDPDPATAAARQRPQPRRRRHMMRPRGSLADIAQAIRLRTPVPWLSRQSPRLAIDLAMPCSPPRTFERRAAQDARRCSLAAHPAAPRRRLRLRLPCTRHRHQPTLSPAAHPTTPNANHRRARPTERIYRAFSPNAASRRRPESSYREGS